MSKNNERMLVLARLGRETIIKNGTYDVKKTRRIDSDHPENYERDRLESLEEDEAAMQPAQTEPVPEPVSDEAPPAPAVEEPVAEEDAEALAAQILSSNFKVGMSQSDVDDFLKGMV